MRKAVDRITMDSPCGALTVWADGNALVRLTFGSADGCGSETPLLRKARTELADYFSGKRRTFDLPLAPTGTPFQQAIWRALCTIPYGTTLSYAQLAERAGHPGACRAAGTANGKNPLPILIPCHRVIHTDGSLGGYSSGLEIKRILLKLENDYA